MGNIIEHSGIIDKIDNNRIQLLFNQQTTCNECQANGVCHPVDKEKIIFEIENSDLLYKQGDQVIVCGQKSIALQSVLFAFILPLFLIIITIYIFISIHLPEIISGILSIGVLLSYYSILSFFNTKLKQNSNSILKKDTQLTLKVPFDSINKLY